MSHTCCTSGSPSIDFNSHFANTHRKSILWQGLHLFSCWIVWKLNKQTKPNWLSCSCTYLYVARYHGTKPGKNFYWNLCFSIHVFSCISVAVLTSLKLPLRKNLSKNAYIKGQEWHILDQTYSPIATFAQWPEVDVWVIHKTEGKYKATPCSSMLQPECFLNYISVL